MGKSWIKQNIALKRVILTLIRCMSPVINVANLRALPAYAGFFANYLEYRAAGGRAAALDLWPCLFDKTVTSRVDTHYFNQSVWAMRHIQASKPASHVDIGSEVNFVGMLTALTQVTFVDIRPLELSIPNFKSVAGSITALPFDGDSVESLSCLHVIEHIGLGRYGDPIDPLGPEKAAAEICRVLSRGGRAYVSTPVGRARVQFNGQRVFAISEVRRLFQDLDLVSFALVDSNGQLHENADWQTSQVEERGAGLDYGLGMYLFQKQRRKN